MTVRRVTPWLTDIETLLWGLEDHDAKLRAVITVVVLLDSSPGIEHLRARSEVLIAGLPRLRQRIQPGALGLVRPQWVDDHDFDPAWHVRVVGAPDTSGLPGVLRVVEPLATEGLDRTRPPWQMLLIEGVDKDGGAALVVRLHHVYADGVGAVRLAAILFDLTPDAPAPAAAPAPPDLAGSAGASDFRPADAVADTLGRSAALAREWLPALLATARDALSDPQPRAQAIVDMLRSVATVSSPTARPLSPAMVGRSIASRLGTVEVDLERMAGAGRAAGGTINDVFVAGLLDGLRRYHDVHLHHPEVLRIGLAVNLRSDGSGEDLSNAFAPARITAPLQVVDAGERIAVVHGLVLAQRHQPAHGAVDLLAGMIHRLPGGMAIVSSALGAIDAMASNVPGPPLPLWLGRARVRSLYPFGPRSGSGLNMTLLSYQGAALIGVHADPAATPDSEVLLQCLAEGFEATVG